MRAVAGHFLGDLELPLPLLRGVTTVCVDMQVRVAALCDRLIVVTGDDALSMEAQKNATLLFQCLVRSTLAAKRVLREWRLTADAFEWLVGEVEARFFQAMAFPGEMVGTVADARLAVIEGARLFAHEERPEQVAAALREVLR